MANGASLKNLTMGYDDWQEVKGFLFRPNGVLKGTVRPKWCYIEYKVNFYALDKTPGF